MHLSLRGRLLAAAMVFSTMPIALAPPAHAQVSVEISFDSFHDRLARYGDWVYSDRWGMVWQPGDVPDDFRPYDTGGHWEYTDEYGWTWISDYDWGDVAFHYGRWVYDPEDGWLWMPGYVWSPAWVVWRGNNDYLGWMPMPPDNNFLYGRGDIGVSVSWGDPVHYYNDWYGPSFGGAGSLWVFVNYGHIADRDYQRYRAPRGQVVNLVQQTTNITNYTVVNNYVVNRSIDVHRVEQAAHRQIQPVPARSVMKHPDMIATVAHGEQVRAQMINVAPRGTGKPGSAPPPPPAVIDKLSDHTVARGPGRRGGPSQHLFTKSALTQPGAVNRFHGKPVAPAGATATASQGTAPNNGAMNREHRPGADNRPNGMSGPQNDKGMLGRNQQNGPGGNMRGETPPPTTGPSKAAPYNRVGNGEHGPPSGMTGPGAGPENNGRANSRSDQGPSNKGGAQSGPDTGTRMMYRGPRNITAPDNAPPERLRDRSTGPGPDNNARIMDRGPRNTTGAGPDNGPPSQRMPAERLRERSTGPAGGAGPDNGSRTMGRGSQTMTGPNTAAPPPVERGRGAGPAAGTPPGEKADRGNRREHGGDQEKSDKKKGPPPE